MNTVEDYKYACLDTLYSVETAIADSIATQSENNIDKLCSVKCNLGHQLSQL